MHHQNGYVRIFGAGDLVAQQVEHNTFNVGVLGSSPSGITLQATTEAICFGCLFCGSAVVRKRPCPPQNKHRLAGRSLSPGFVARVARIIAFNFQRYPRECFALRAPAGSLKKEQKIWSSCCFTQLCNLGTRVRPPPESQIPRSREIDSFFCIRWLAKCGY